MPMLIVSHNVNERLKLAIKIMKELLLSWHSRYIHIINKDVVTDDILNVHANRKIRKIEYSDDSKFVKYYKHEEDKQDEELPVIAVKHEVDLYSTVEFKYQQIHEINDDIVDNIFITAQNGIDAQKEYIRKFGFNEIYTSNDYIINDFKNESKNVDLYKKLFKNCNEYGIRIIYCIDNLHPWNF